MTGPIYVSYYTPDYADCAAKLKASLDQFGLHHELMPVKDLGRWDLNCTGKAACMRIMLNAHQCPVVWIDSDAIVRRPPELFDRLADENKIDVAVCRWKRLNSMRRPEVLSGTVYVGNTDGGRRLLDKWDAECKAHPQRWDQVSLEVSLGACDLRIEWLPVEYTFISDIHRWEYPNASPVVEHYQRSRIRKAREISESGI